ncbi:hypothetical protein MRX96_032228 [Rhipicephalus microplus]
METPKRYTLPECLNSKDYFRPRRATEEARSTEFKDADLRNATDGGREGLVECAFPAATVRTIRSKQIAAPSGPH